MKFNISVFITAAFISSFSAHGIPYDPEGSLYDNDQNNFDTSLASQLSDAEFDARTADDFSFNGAACPSGVFDINQIRVQMVQTIPAPQPFAVELYADNGSGTAPMPGINPSHTYPETSQTLLGPFGAFNLFEASFNTPGLQLAADTPYWLSALGSDGAANTTRFNNFFASSAGAAGTTANGVIIAPDAGFPDWVTVQIAIGTPQAFSFAIDGSCAPSLSECAANDLNCIGTYINYKRVSFCDSITESSQSPGQYLIATPLGPIVDSTKGGLSNDLGELIETKCFPSPP